MTPTNLHTKKDGCQQVHRMKIMRTLWMPMGPSLAWILTLVLASLRSWVSTISSLHHPNIGNQKARGNHALSKMPLVSLYKAIETFLNRGHTDSNRGVWYKM